MRRLRGQRTGAGGRDGLRLVSATVTGLACACASPAASLPPPVARAVAVAEGLRVRADAADSVLAAHQLDRQSYDSLLFEIARDTMLARLYTAAIHAGSEPTR